MTRPSNRSSAPVLLAVGSALLGALFWNLAAPPAAEANGGTLRLANVPMGAYLVSVFTDPTPVRPDSLDVSVLVVMASNGAVAEGVEVTLRTRHLEGLAPDSERAATREAADDPRYHAAKFALGAEGPWEIQVTVRGPEGQGDAAFEVRARERGLLGHPAMLVFLALLPLLLVGGWILRQGGSGGEAGAEDGGAGRAGEAPGEVSPSARR
jgi:hypothetical protein